MVTFPKAKINLGLTITGRRPDGYHDIETIFYPLPFCDALEMVVSTESALKDLLTITGLDIKCQNEDNLVLKTVSKLREIYSFPYLKIHLHKVVPAGAGLGGGSSDAASILCLINRYFGYPLSTEYLRKLALGLGSDCPFFIYCKPALAIGRGEILVPIGDVLEGLHILLLNPGISISTKEAYENCTPGVPAIRLEEIANKPITEWKDLMMNDFERIVFRKFPLIGLLKNKLYESGALYSSMSGSGSSVYGIFSRKPVIPDDLKEYVIYTGKL